MFGELTLALDPSRPITSIRFIGPYKIGKTSALNYYRKQSGAQYIFYELKQDGRDNYTKIIAQWFVHYADYRVAQLPDNVVKKLWEHLRDLTEVMYVQESRKEFVLDEWQDYWNENDPQLATILEILRQQPTLVAYWNELTIVIKNRMPHSGSSEDCWGKFFPNLQEALNGTSVSSRRKYFTNCWTALNECGALDLNTIDVLVFWEEFEGAVPEVDAMPLTLDPTIFPNSPVQIKYICVGREPYRGVQEDVPNPSNERSGSPGFEGTASRSALSRQSTQKTIELHAFTRDDALRFVRGESVGLPFIHMPVPCQESIPDQVGYHPALLQIMCWGILSEFYTPTEGSGACWDDCLEKINEIKTTISVLLEEEREVILNAHRGISQQSIQRLSGKGVVL